MTIAVQPTEGNKQGIVHKVSVSRLRSKEKMEKTKRRNCLCKAKKNAIRHIGVSIMISLDYGM